MAILVTGGAGFIGSNFILNWLNYSNEKLVNFDKLTYAGNLQNLQAIEKDTQYLFVKGDINNSEQIFDLLRNNEIRAVLNFAAETHVDRSIDAAGVFVQTNIIGTFKLLETIKLYWSGLSGNTKQSFRFIHISTDEVYGSLEKSAAPFTEFSRYDPSSPYSASKASADHLVNSFHRTYNVPAIITHSSNNYGPHQFPEKFIPVCIHHALVGKPIPIYGNGQQIRDWLYVEDHCRAIHYILDKGKVGERYNIGGGNEKTNLEVVSAICRILDLSMPRNDGRSYAEQITYVNDRPGHDVRYALDTSKLLHEINWRPIETFDSGIIKTVQWYLDNQKWLYDAMSHEYCAEQV